MKKSTLFSVFLFVVFLVGCSQINYDHPLDSSVKYEHPEFFNGGDGDTAIADYWDTASAIYKHNLDTIPPTLTLNGPNPLLIPYGDPNHMIDELKKPSAYTVTDNRGSENVTVEIPNIDFSVIFPDTNVIQYTARDKSNNSVTKTKTVIILPEAFVDTIKPSINVSMRDIEIFQNEQFDKMKNVRAYDETDGDITAKIVVSGSVNTATPGVYTLTYKVKDNAGNEFVLERKITVVQSTTHDENFPVITLTGGDTVVIEETATWKEPGYKAEDSTDGNITDKVQFSGEVKSAPGWYQITYTVSDKSSNITTKTRYVRRKGSTHDGDTTPPVISLKYQKDTVVTVVKGATFKAPEVTILDNVDGAILKDSLYTFPKTVSTATTGSFKVALLAHDKAGNEGRLDIKVDVIDGTVDKTPPVITLKGKNPDTVSVSATALYKDSGATVTDDIDKNLTATVKGSVDRTKEGTYTLTYTASDAAGNADTATRTVVVKQTSSSNLLEKYQVPGAAGLADVNKSYTSATIDGDATAAPNLTNMSSFTINWSRSQNAVYGFAINMPNPINYVDLKDKITQTFSKTGPTVKITGVTQIPKLDGEYYVAIDGTSFVMVNTDGSFAIILK
jgi:PBP1b-binding outer membrane lipoprotein LpoB